MIFNLFPREMRFFRVEDFTTTFKHLQLALPTAGLTTTGRRQENTILVEGRHHAAALWHLYRFIAIDFYFYVTAWAEIFLGYKQHNDEKEYDDEEYPYA